MNTPNNKRKKESVKKIEKAFLDILQTNNLNQIKISDICKSCNLSRVKFVLRSFKGFKFSQFSAQKHRYQNCIVI